MSEERKYEIDKKVIVEIIKKTLNRIEGIHSIKRSLWGEDIKIKVSDEGLNLRLGLIVKSGTVIPEVAEKANQELKETIEKTLGLPVVNLKIKYEIDKKVIVEIIKKTLNRIEGIHSIKRSLWGEDIKIKVSDEGLNLRLGLIVKSGTVIPEVAEKANQELKETIEKTLGLPVVNLKIKIKGIKFSR